MLQEVLEKAIHWLISVVAWIRSHPTGVAIAVNAFVFWRWTELSKSRPPSPKRAIQESVLAKFRGRNPTSPQGREKRLKAIAERLSDGYSDYLKRFKAFFIPGLLYWVGTTVVTSFALFAIQAHRPLFDSVTTRWVDAIGNLGWQAGEALSFGLPSLLHRPPPTLSGGVGTRLMLFAFGLNTTFLAAALISEVLSLLSFTGWALVAPLTAIQVVKGQGIFRFLPSGFRELAFVRRRVPPRNQAYLPYKDDHISSE